MLFLGWHLWSPTLRKVREGWGTIIGLFKRALSWHVARLAQALVVAAVVCVSLAATDPAKRFDDLGGKLMCSCGCEQVVKGCDHVGCTYRSGELDEIRTGIAAGQSDSLILASFVQKYGKTVLSSPTTQGFDLVAWIMPFAVAALALIGTIFLVRHWAKSQAKLAPVKAVRSDAAGAELQERIRRETGTD